MLTPCRLAAAFVCLCIAGCGGGCGSANGEPVDDDSVADEQSGGETRVPPPRESEEIIDPGPAPVLRVVGEPNAHTRAVGIRIENRGDESTEIAGTLELWRLTDGVWRAEGSVQLDLRYSCEDEVAACVTLAPGATYLPPEWLGSVGRSQCACEGCAAAPAGSYRYVVRSCNRAHSVEGVPFEIH